MNHASNVIGTVQDIEAIGRICEEAEVLFAVDAAQTAGVVPIDMAESRVDFVCFTGHKGLFGPTGSHHFFVLDGMTAEAPAGKPIKIAMRGAVEKQFPYTVSFNAGRADLLMRGAQPWPFQLTVDFLGGVLRLDGTVALTAGKTVVELLFGLGAEDLSDLLLLIEP